jgi:hypothetical protein
MPLRATFDVGRSTWIRRGGATVLETAKRGAGGGAAALHRLQWSQACDGTGLAGVSSAGEVAPALLWQITENGSAAVASAIGATALHRITCRAIA